MNYFLWSTKSWEFVHSILMQNVFNEIIGNFILITTVGQFVKDTAHSIGRC